MNIEEEKRLAAEAAGELVKDGMRVGLGTGSTVAFLLRAIARRGPRPASSRRRRAPKPPPARWVSTSSRSTRSTASISPLTAPTRLRPTGG